MESVIVSNDERIAIAEVDYVIHHMNERYLEKIPKKIVDYITILKKKNIDIYVDPKIPLEMQGLKEFTLYFLMILNLKYWCNDERRKEILSMMENNQKKYEDKINNFFDQAEDIKGEVETSTQEDTSKPKKVITINTEEVKKEKIPKEKEEVAPLAKQKENFLKKFLNKIKSLIKK